MGHADRRGRAPLTADPRTDETLAAAVAGGEAAAFRELYRRYHLRIHGIALHLLRDQAEAEEVTQDVFIELHRSAARFRGESRLGTWLHRVTVRKTIDQLRRARRKKRFAPLTRLFGLDDPRDPVIPGPVHPGIQAERREEAALLAREVDALPESQRTALLLSYVDGLPRQEAADAMGIGLKALESLLQRAKANLRKRLDPHYPGRRKSGKPSSNEVR
ncbi:MAG: RNA polymerase sigma factor [Gemmatimonadales bacterium]